MNVEGQRPPDFADDFRVGDWLVEPSLDRVSRNGTVLRLRPQLTDLLVLLARHAGQTVSRDEILAKVWDGHQVAESGMTRCIAEIRQALEDDARDPKILETIPKRGYRLVAPVVFLPRSAPPAEGSSASASNSPAAVPTATPEDMPGAPWANPDADRTATRPRSRFSRRTVYVALLAVASSVAAMVVWQPWAAGRAAAPVDQHTVVLADVVNTTGDPAFDDALKLALAVQLGQAPFLRILPADQVRAALGLMGRPGNEAIVGPVALEVCRRERGSVVLAGSIRPLGRHYAVAIEAFGCRTGDSIARELVEASGKEGVLTALGKATAGMRQQLGESRASLRQYDAPIVRATTSSLDALKALSLGDLRRDGARPEEARAFYRRATELDPQFALAWARRGAAASNVGDWDEALPAFRRAYELRDRASEPERFYIEAHYRLFVEDDPAKAVETYKMWQQVYPGSTIPPSNLASIQIGAFGQYDAALPAAREAVRLAPYSALAHSKLVLAYLGTGRLEEAKKALGEAARRGAVDLQWRGLAFDIAFTTGDEAGMAEHVKWAEGNALASLVMTEYRATAAVSTGRLREARRLWAEMAALAGTPARQAPGRLVQAETEALLGDAPAARHAADAAAAADPQPATQLCAAIVLGLLGDAARPEALVNGVTRRGSLDGTSTRVWLPVARALIEANRGRYDAALALLRPVAPFERGRNYGFTPIGVRGWIELKSGHAAEAAATFQEIQRLGPAAATNPWVAFSRLGLARALEKAGDRAGSRRAYDAFLGAMPRADAEAPLLRVARAERAALDAG